MDISPRILLLGRVFISQKRNKRGEIGIGKRVKVVKFDCFYPFCVEHKEIVGNRYGHTGTRNIAKGGENRGKWVENGQNCSIF